MHWMVYVFAMAFSGYAFSETNLCRVADTRVIFTRAIFSNKLDSMTMDGTNVGWNLHYDSDGKLKMQVGVGDTVDFQWIGLSVRSQSRGESSYQVMHLNQDFYPVSQLYYDSSGFIYSSYLFRYGSEYYVEFSPDEGGLDSSSFSVEDSVVFTQSGLKRFAEGNTLIQECQTVENYCLCEEESVDLGEPDTVKFFSTHGLLDSVQYQSDPTVAFYWSRPHSSIKSLIKPRQIRQGEARVFLHRRDILGRLQKPY
jgi:hypothetical protein